MSKSSGPKTCGFRLCPAFAVDGHEFCPVHSPDKVQARARQIVCNNFADALMPPLDKTTIELLVKLRADIVRDLEDTV